MALGVLDCLTRGSVADQRHRHRHSGAAKGLRAPLREAAPGERRDRTQHGAREVPDAKARADRALNETRETEAAKELADELARVASTTA